MQERTTNESSPSGVIRPARRPEGWQAPGPAPATGEPHGNTLPRVDEDLCYLCGDWRILQKLRGHRWSIDDLATAHQAIHFLPTSAREQGGRHLDLGTGIGSVLLQVAWSMPSWHHIGIEAQVESLNLARRSLQINGAQARCDLLEGDFRTTEHESLQPAAFDLITGTPPYFLEHRGVVSNLPQRGPCRFELRGGVEDYLQAIKRYLADDGHAVVCCSVLQTERFEREAQNIGLDLCEVSTFYGRAGKAPLFVVYSLRHADDGATPTVRTHIQVRDANGQFSPAMSAIRDAMGIPGTGVEYVCARRAEPGASCAQPIR